MKVVIPLLVLSNLVVASAAIARDSKEVLRDHLAFCSQFVIQDRDPSIVLNYCMIAAHCRIFAIAHVRFAHDRTLMRRDVGKALPADRSRATAV
jgi:hypothetical protein